MNKDVIYVEPEDDITDIITKIENAKEKIVALVPPKKASVFRSIVNIKLINKAGISASKKVVLVTTDPSVVKLAAVAKLPVTKSLQSAPSIPTIETKEETTTSEELVQKKDGEAESEEKSEESADEDSDEKEEKEEKKDEKAEKTEDSEEKSEDKPEDNKKADKKAKKEKGASKNWFVAHRALIIAGASAFVVLLLVGIWMFVLAPAVEITVSIRTTQNNFSENATFVSKLQDEVAAEGKFYIEEKKQENKVEVDFDATGQKNTGEKAKGQVIVIASFRSSGSASVEKGDTFTQGDYTFIADDSVTLSWDGNNANGCDNKNAPATDFLRDGCIVSKTVDVTAEKPGTAYNIEAAPANWRSSTGFGVYSSAAMTGGTDNMITVVQQSDIDKALSEIGSSNEQVNRNKLLDSISEDRAIVIDSSFTQTTADPVSSPALGEEVKDGKKARLTVTTTTSIYIIDKTKVEEFIAAKAKLSESFKIYEINEPYVDNFIKSGETYTGKLKAVYVSGPKVTENDIVDMAKGKGLGSAQHELSSIDGVSKITIDPSYPWVSSVPNDPEKITVNIKVDNQEK